jgi:hypothetical protein
MKRRLREELGMDTLEQGMNRRTFERTASLGNSPQRRRKLLTALLAIIFIFLIASSSECHGQVICTAPPTITSVTSSQWFAGLSINVTIIGSGFYGEDTPACTTVAAYVSEDTGAVSFSQVNVVSDTEIDATVTIPSTIPAEAACVVVAHTSVMRPIIRGNVRSKATTDAECTGSSTSAAFPVQIGNNLLKHLGNPCDLPGCGGVGDPINVSSGNVFEEVIDYETAGANKLSYIRYYNSLTAASTYAWELGSNWRSNYDRILQIPSSDLITAERPDGQQINFYNNRGSWTSDGDVDYTLTQSGTTWTLTDRNDTTEVYSDTGWGMGLLQSITLRNGYAQTMSYNSYNQLTSVTDSYSRQLTLTYPNGQLATVTTPDGLVLTYGYNSVYYYNDQLASVSYSTSPATSQQYLYQNTSLPYALTSIQDENGATYASWTYDSLQRGLTSQTGGTANLTTMTYDDTGNTRTVTNARGVTDTYTLAYLQNDFKITNVSRAATSTTAAATETYSYD